MAIGKVLKGLKARPIPGKNTGADCNITVIAVSIDPIQISLILLLFFMYINKLKK